MTMAMVAIFFNFVEADPEQVWDDDRLDRLRAELDAS